MIIMTMIMYGIHWKIFFHISRSKELRVYSTTKRKHFILLQKFLVYQIFLRKKSCGMIVSFNLNSISLTY